MPQNDEPIIDIKDLDRAIRCTNDSVYTINQIVAAGTHEPDTIDDMDPDDVCWNNREFLIQFLPSLEAAGAGSLPQVYEAIIAATEFLNEKPSQEIVEKLAAIQGKTK